MEVFVCFSDGIQDTGPHRIEGLSFVPRIGDILDASLFDKSNFTKDEWNFIEEDALFLWEVKKVSIAKDDVSFYAQVECMPNNLFIDDFLNKHTTLSVDD